MPSMFNKIKSLFSSSRDKSTASPGNSAHSGVPVVADSTTDAAETTATPQLLQQPQVIITPPTPHPTLQEMSQPTNTNPINDQPPVAATATATTTTTTDTPAFDANKVTVIFVLGGPGAGKGTQCAKLVKEYNFVHLSAGDLLRAEQSRPDSKVGAMIKEYITEGKIVPMQVTIQLLSNAMQHAIDNGQGQRFLIDGFPRQMDQAIKFDESVCPGALVLFLVCPEPILLERLLERGKTSGRDDDNAESIKKRFKTFVDTSMPVVDYYRQMGKVVDIDSSKTIEDVYADIEKGIKPVLDRATAATNA